MREKRERERRERERERRESALNSFKKKAHRRAALFKKAQPFCISRAALFY